MDFRFALRSLLKNPGFTLLAVLVMGLGIGGATAVFSVVHTVLLKPLDYPEPDRIVTVRNLWKSTGHVSQNVSGPDFHDWQRQNTCFSALAYYTYTGEGGGVVKAGSTAEYAPAAVVTPNFFDVFGIRPALGHGFGEGERSALISYGFWQSHYGGRADALGRTLRVEDQDLAIAGVLPPGFSFPGRTDVWVPSTLLPETTSRTAHNYRAVARLKPGISVEQAQAEMTAIAARIERQFPENRNKSARVMPLRDTLVQNVSATLYVLLGAVGVLLLIACANVASLLLARGTARSREIAIRAAVGASRWRILRLLAAESLLLAILSGAAGLLLAWWGAGALVALAPRNIPRLAETGLDAPVLAFSLACSLACCLLSGLAPAFAAARAAFYGALQAGARGTTSGGAGRLRGALVLAEIAAAVVLLSAAGLLMRSFLAMSRTELGFRPEHLLVMQASVPVTDKAQAARAWQYYDRVLEKVSALPGVSAVGATVVPPGDTASNGGYSVDHPSKDPSSNGPQAEFSVITPGLLRTLGIPLQAGRDFDARDRDDAPNVAIVNETFARVAFPGENPLGRLIYSGFTPTNAPLRIVGVAGDVRQFGPASKPAPEIMLCYRQQPFFASSMSVLVRTASEPAATAETVRRQALGVSPDVPVRFTTMQALLSENVAAPRFRTLLVGIFAALALALAAAGVYGVMAYAVGRRTGEIGIRMAMGARPADVLLLVLRQGLLLAAGGLALGLAGALAATRLLRAMLFDVTPADPLTYAAVAAALALVALAACYVPARRAMKLDPLAALRQE